jgi:hypothetical protein
MRTPLFSPSPSLSGVPLMVFEADDDSFLSQLATGGPSGELVHLRANLLTMLDAVTEALRTTTIVQLVGLIDAVKVAMCASCSSPEGNLL